MDIEWITADENACELCRKKAGKVIDANERPPLHEGCRCYWIPHKPYKITVDGLKRNLKSPLMTTKAE